MSVEENSAPALPPGFVREMESLLGAEEGARLCDALDASAAPVSLRKNPLKTPPALPAPEEGSVPWCETGVYLSSRPRFTHDPLLHAGCYYVQEASSMFVERAYRKIEEDFTPRRVLDLCAAPGGKSTLWRSLLPDGALLVANEPVRLRAQILAENLAKWGHPDVVCTMSYPEEFAPLAGFFDVVAADVPCSGEGMFRKDPAARTEWSEEAVAACAVRQREIVAAVWPALRSGGYLVYSTCTFNREEDEDNVRFICRELGAECVAVDTDPAWGVTGDVTGGGLPVARFLPSHTTGEGLFVALLRKTADQPEPRVKRTKKAAAKAPRPKGVAEAARLVAPSADFDIMPDADGTLIAVRRGLSDDVRRVCATVRPLTAGVALVAEKGRKLVPQHALALSTCRAKDAFPEVELGLEDALRYLRREVLTLPAGVPRGYVVVTYCGHAIGFANNLGARANNMYPAEWRVRF